MFDGKRKPQSPPPAPEPKVPPTFEEQLDALGPELAKVRAMQPKDRVRLFVRWFEQDEPDEAASKILRFHNGVEREAERDAWAMFDFMAEGSPGNRKNEGGFNYGNELVKHILNGTENPRVERRAVELPAFR